jgi:hypothetical protein
MYQNGGYSPAVDANLCNTLLAVRQQDYCDELLLSLSGVRFLRITLAN